MTEKYHAKDVTAAIDTEYIYNLDLTSMVREEGSFGIGISFSWVKRIEFCRENNVQPKKWVQRHMKCGNLHETRLRQDKEKIEF